MYKLLLCVYKSLAINAPAYINNLLNPYNPPCKLQSYTPINCKTHYLTPGEGASSLRLYSQKSDSGYVKIQ